MKELTPHDALKLVVDFQNYNVGPTNWEFQRHEREPEAIKILKENGLFELAQQLYARRLKAIALVYRRDGMKLGYRAATRYLRTHREMFAEEGAPTLWEIHIGRTKDLLSLNEEKSV